MSANSSILGHTSQLAQLRTDLDRGNVSHAYLFSGPPHIGKSTVARWFALQLLKQETDQSEEVVRDQMERLIHPDFLSLDALWMEERQEDWDTIGKSSNVPQQHRQKAKAKTDSISIEDVRALQERLFDSALGRYRCCFIRGVERMQAAAANAFLKVLEEPPSRVVFLLTTDAQQELLSTILSRTRLLHFHPLTVREMQPILTSASDDDRPFVAHLAQGASGTALQLLKDPERLRAEKQLHGQAAQFWGSLSVAERVRWLTSVAAKPDELDRVLLHLGLTLRESTDVQRKPQRTRAYMDLLTRLQTNAHRALILQQFALQVDTQATLV